MSTERWLIHHIWVALFGLAACIDNTPARVDTAETTADSVEDGADGIDIEVADTSPTDTLEDAADTTDTADGNDADTTACEPVACTLYCEHGFANGPDGCPVCACRDCAEPGDCTRLDCASPVCTGEGSCLCDCAGVEPVTYDCPDGTDVAWCACSALGWDCLEHPEYQCPTLCTPSTSDPWFCPDGGSVPWCECEAPGCEPRCERVGEAEEGWYDGCSGELIVARPCAGCEMACTAIGTRSEGWYDACEGRIAWGFCAPSRRCVESPEKACDTLDCTIDQASDHVCPDEGTVPFCGCEVPAAACEPTCEQVGTSDEGWYDGCTGALVRLGVCALCEVTCDAIGSRSEGWYSSCDGLIAWESCATGTWACETEPWRDCTGGLACTGQGGEFIAPRGQCCPGLTQLDYTSWDGEQCGYVDCLCYVCTVCGDGACDAPENPCNCADDCPR